MDTTLVKGTYIIAKIMEVGNWILCGCLLIGAILVSVSPEMLTSANNLLEGAINVYGFEVQLFDNQGVFLNGILQGALIIGAIVLSLTAMMFRNIYLIGRLSLGQTSHSEGITPFQPDNVRMIREIGYFAILVPGVQYLGSVILRIIFGVDTEISGFAYMGFVFGIAMLCLSQVFAYGVQLQQDTDGLI